MNLVLPEGARNWGEEGMQSKGYICTCPVVLHCFVDIFQQVFGLFLRMTQHVIYSQVGSVCDWEGGGGGGAAGPHPQGYA